MRSVPSVTAPLANLAPWLMFEVHDLSAHDLDAARRLFDWLERWPSLPHQALWIPEYQGHRPRNEAQRALARLIDDARAEPVLHGLWHGERGTALDRLRFGEGWRCELLGRNLPEAKAMIRRGRDLIQQALGRPVDWFCAPRWHQGKGTVAALAELDMSGYFTIKHVQLLGQPPIRAPAVWLDSGARAGVNRLLAQWQQRRFEHCLEWGRPFRLVIHPRDTRDPAIEPRLRAMVERALTSGWPRLVPSDLERRCG